jgi:predicted alpha/beta superfamily hydrolase
VRGGFVGRFLFNGPRREEPSPSNPKSGRKEDVPMTIPRTALCTLAGIAMLVLSPPVAFGFQENGALPSERIAQGDQITVGRIVSFRSEVFGGDRQVLVYLPDDYSSSKAGYPVVYLLDGAFFFLSTGGLVDFYSMINRMPRMIVVAIVHWDRMHELSTAPDGGSSQFTSFLREELIPFIDGHFRTEPFRILIGHSLGGLFSVHALFEAPDLFQAHIAASPGLHWNGRSELEKAREALRSNPSLESTLYLTYSGGDGENIRTSTDQLIDMLEASGSPNLNWKFEFLPDDRHNSSPIRSVLGGLNFLFSSWTYLGEDSAEAFIEHYRLLSEQLGFECRPEMGDVASRGRSLIRKGDVAGAIRVFEYNAQIHPEAPETHEALGSAYSSVGNIPMAIAAFERALELRPESKEIPEILRQLRGGGGRTLLK